MGSSFLPIIGFSGEEVKGVLWEPVGHVMNLKRGTERRKLTGEPYQEEHLQVR